MSYYEIFLAVLFAVWAAATAAFQFDVPSIRRWSYRDCFGLLPLWTFFAPTPGQTDYHLLYRDQLTGGDLSPWSEIALTEGRKLHSACWNPEKRSKKVLSDVVQMLIETSAALQAPQHVILSTPYVLVLNVVMNEPRSADAARRMFVIAQTQGFLRTTDPQPLVRSALHAFS